MNRCTNACVGQLRSLRLTIDGQKRWVSYDRSKLSREQILRQIQAEITRIENRDNPINLEKKTIETEAGELPLSPILDAEWVASRRRFRKPKAGIVSGQFRKHLSNNPYAEALMTPMRWCKNTNAILPRHFLQDFELVKHPDSTQTEVWYAPGPLAFVNVMPWSLQRPGEDKESNANAQIQEMGVEKHEAPDTTSQRETSTNSEETSQEKETEKVEDDILEGQEKDSLDGEIREDSHRPARFVIYTLSRKSLIDIIAITKSLQAKMTAQRNGMGAHGIPPVGKRIFRPDMGDLLLKMMRRQAVDALIARSSSKRDGKDPYKFIMPVESWEEAAQSVAGGAVLYIPTEPTEDMNNYATLDVQNANYGGKVAVHDLVFLLGESEVERLRTEAKEFQGQELLILKNHRSESMRSLFLLLWRLQGYLAEPQAELIEPRQY
ncbi:hypothetical protein FPOAC1_002200 [Fusarium poae]|uniref:Uncharacterized protein n=1 Tax=Fusarium poae TaxID=36050 RepID=A0A1B8B606_FUSPO|nr:hypothetical protein FPOAC1_002200 [Fusarium poae]KAG8676199.1 hypothetical protein FPOAC1_002200 [Fusarium poae]OBS28155.1 hypothetical protein FPOA_02096 [Fusarium poae]